MQMTPSLTFSYSYYIEYFPTKKMLWAEFGLANRLDDTPFYFIPSCHIFLTTSLNKFFNFGVFITLHSNVSM